MTAPIRMVIRADEVLPEDIIVGLDMGYARHAIWVHAVAHDIKHRTVHAYDSFEDAVMLPANLGVQVVRGL